MTRTQIDEIADAVYSAHDATVMRLLTCNARIISSDDVGAKLLISYRTPVALLLDGVVYEGRRCSKTTTSHVRKFAHLYGAPVVSLYRTPRMGIREFERHTACDWADIITAQE